MHKSLKASLELTCQQNNYLNESDQRRTQSTGGQMSFKGEYNSNTLGECGAFPVEVAELQRQTTSHTIQFRSQRT